MGHITGPFEYGDWAAGGSGSRTDVRDFIQSVRLGKRNAELLDLHPECMAKYPRLVDNVRACMREEMEAAKEWPHEGLYPWQQALVEYLEDNPRPRKIRWYVDERGGHGKTTFARQLVRHGAFYMRGGKSTDVAYMFKRHVDNNVHNQISIFDFSRESREFINYGIIEQIKDGMITSSKYESSLVLCDVQHVIVFSNFEPDRSKLSEDRWDVIYLN